MEEIIKRLAKEYGLREIAVETIVKSQFNKVIEVMKEGGHKNIRLQGFGIFAVKPGRLDYKKKKDE